MKRVTGIGGVFFRAKDPAAMQAWYKERLGLPVGEDGNTAFLWREAEDPERDGMTVWAAFPADTDYFGESGQQWMIDKRRITESSLGSSTLRGIASSSGSRR